MIPSFTAPVILLPDLSVASNSVTRTY